MIWELVEQKGIGLRQTTIVVLRLVRSLRLTIFGVTLPQRGPWMMSFAQDLSPVTCRELLCQEVVADGGS